MPPTTKPSLPAPTADPWTDIIFSDTTTKGDERLMLRLVAYDIADPRRLRRIASVCEDFGVRVQKSVFEAWLDDHLFDRLWARLLETIEPAEDLIIAYSLDQPSAARRRLAGRQTCARETLSYAL